MSLAWDLSKKKDKDGRTLHEAPCEACGKIVYSRPHKVFERPTPRCKRHARSASMKKLYGLRELPEKLSEAEKILKSYAIGNWDNGKKAREYFGE